MKSFCIIGLGNFGKTLALTLIRNGHQVMVIDQNEEEIDEIGDLMTSAICGDATNEGVLRSAGINNYDCCIVCLKDNMQDSILTTLILKEMGANKIVARATSERHKKVLTKLGADIVVFPEKDMGMRLALTLSKNDVLEYFNLSDKYSIAEIMVPKRWVGMSIRELDVRKKYGINIIATCDADNENFEIFNTPERLFRADEKVVIVGNNESIEKIADK
ncbi:MAG: TrkA family potassium uptake protein [Eubacteriales bacterium]|nr:TrkA family potassium uptake protein [Eubacteriales bacterium]MDD4422079.1 TrkA family potassium uptake protein [Eubacteriales bacterium]